MLTAQAPTATHADIIAALHDRNARPQIELRTDKGAVRFPMEFGPTYTGEPMTDGTDVDASGWTLAWAPDRSIDEYLDAQGLHNNACAEIGQCMFEGGDTYGSLYAQDDWDQARPPIAVWRIVIGD
jgi:hypothetical protein